MLAIFLYQIKVLFGKGLSWALLGQVSQKSLIQRHLCKRRDQGKPSLLKTITKERKYFRILTQDVSVILLINNDEEKILPFYSIFFLSFKSWLDTLSTGYLELTTARVGRRRRTMVAASLMVSWRNSPKPASSLTIYTPIHSSVLQFGGHQQKSHAQLCNLHRSEVRGQSLQVLVFQYASF